MSRSKKIKRFELLFTRVIQLILMALLSITSVFSQEKLARFQHIEPSESFANRAILAVTQDEQGYLWFASLFGGLARYDGYEFKTFLHDPLDPNSLPTNEVHSLFAANDDQIWIGTDDGLVRLDTTTDQLTVYRHDPDVPSSISHSNIGPIIQDSRGDLWIGAENGLNRMESGSETFKHYPLLFENTDPNVFTPARWVWSLSEDAQGNLWAGTLGGGLLLYDRARDSFERILHDPENPKSLPGNVVRAISQAPDGSMWFGTNGGLAKLHDPDGMKFDVIRTSELFPDRNLPPPGAILWDSRGSMWISVYDGVLVQSADSNEFELMTHDSSDPGSIGSGRIWTLFEDRSGVLWIPSDSISWLVPTTDAFALHARELPPNDENHLTLDSAGRLWTGSRDGMIGMDLATGEWYEHQPFSEPENPSDNWIKGAGFYEDAGGTLWVTTSRRLNRFDPNTKNFDSFDLPAEPNALTRTKDGLIWMGLPFTGLASLDVSTGDLMIHGHDDSDPHSVSHDFGYAVLEDQEGRLWYGTQNGLNLFDRETGEAKRFFADRDDPTSLSNDTVRIIFEDHVGRLWFGTQFGLNLLDESGSGFTQFFNGPNAADNIFNSLVSFGDGRLWAATDNGIARFSIATREFANFSFSEGLPANWRQGLQAGENGLLYTLNSAGFIVIDTNRLDIHTDPPPIVLTDFRLFNEPVPVSSTLNPTVLPENIGSLDRIYLSHSDKVVSFRFAALDFFNPQQNKYQFRLTGFDDQWITTDAGNRTATFTDLAPGDYEFRVRAANHAGQWNEAGLSLGIKVSPPLWRTWWAYMLYAFAVLSALTLFYNWRTRLLRIRSVELEEAVLERTEQLSASERIVREQADDLQELLDLKERLFTNISHEFRTPLTLMIGPIDNAISESRSDRVVASLQMARRNGKRVVRLVDQLLELSRLSSDEPLRMTPQPLAPLVAAVCDAFRPYARDQGITLSVMTDDQLWVNCTPEAIERILMNLLSNALKFTAAGGRVNVSLREHKSGDPVPKLIELEVFDTGRGIPENERERVFERFQRVDDLGETVPGSGIGLALVKELVAAHDGRIEIESKLGKGTVVTVLLSAYEVKPGVEMVTDPQSSEALKLEVDVLEQPPEYTIEKDRDEDSGLPQILVIEDNRDMQYYLHQLLSGFYRVELAGDGDVGLQSARDNIPDLIICDVMLPKRDGYLVVNELKSDQRTSHIPVVMLTARSDEDSRLEGLREHVDDYLTKPFNDEELMLRVANLLAVRDILKARYSGQLNTGEDPRSGLNEPEQNFLNRLEDVLASRYSDQDFSISDMAAGVALSPRQLQRKLKALTDQQPGHYLRLYRLKRSEELLRRGKLVGDVAFSVGFGSPAHFSSCFKAQFGYTPTEYQSNNSTVGSR